jgi:type II secretion system protein I
MRSGTPVRDTFLRTSPVSSGRGFTLIEVLVALAIIGIALTVIIQLFSADMRNIAASDDYVTAVTLADEKMRQVIEDDDFSERSWSETTPEGYRMEFAITGTLSDRTETLQVQLMEVSLTMHWLQGAREKSLSLRTLKSVPKISL